MEDGDDKLRRNLVVWSALVIAFWFVGGHFAGDAAYGPLKFSSPSDLKAWSAIAIVTVYLGLRHLFSDATKLSEEKMQDEFFAFLERATSRRVVSDFKKMMRTGNLLPAYPSAAEIFQEWYRDSTETFQSDPAVKFDLVLSRNQNHLRFRFDGLSYAITSAYLYRPRSFERTFSGGVLITTKFSRLDRFKLRLKAAIPLITYSHASTEYLLPFALAAIALGISVWRLASLLLVS
jgi:hypothetical protein